MKTDQLSAHSSHTRDALAARRARRRVSARASDAETSRRRALVLNRMLDVSFSVLLLAVMAVPMFFIAMLVKLTSRGPAVYRQERVGLDGRTFTMYKFRTMRCDAENGTPVWSRRGDPRCTAIGNLLRRYCLDELPQFVNVLKGDMSLVGPRPERPFFVERFSQTIPGYNQRHQVPPGITGWAQINGWRGDSSLERRVEFDLFYIRNWSLALNLKILLLTPLRLLVDQTG